MLVFLSNRDKHLTFWLFLLFPLPRIVFHHAKFDSACIRFQILCFWTCSWHFLSAHFHVFPRWCRWQIEINISLFELFHKILDYEFLRYYSMCYTVRVSHVLYSSFLLSFMIFFSVVTRSRNVTNHRKFSGFFCKTSLRKQDSFATRPEKLGSVHIIATQCASS